MVQLVLSSPKGNQGGKYFPYLGFLGLTPVRIEGIVRTKLDPDLKLLPATSLSISVRCYEHRIGRVTVTGSKLLVDYTQVLWAKPDDVEYEPIGVLEYPFRIILPASVAGFSTAVFVDYRCTWRVEAVLTHVPITGVGSRQIRHFELPLVRYDIPRRVSPPASPSGLLDQCTSKPRAPRIRYHLETPTHAVGPGEIISIPLHLQPVESNVTVKNATILIERRIYLRDHLPASPPIPIPATSRSQPTTPASASPHFPSASLSTSHSSSSERPPASLPQDYTFPHSEPAVSSHAFERSTTSLASSNPTITPESVFPSTASILSYASEAPLLSSSSSPQNPPNSSQPPPAQTGSAIQTSPTTAKVVVNPIVVSETESFTRDARGLWSQTLTLDWPTSKSHSRWAIGETISSDFITVKYFIRVKISVSSPVGGTETIELGEKELVVVSTSEQERLNAQATYAELVESGRVSDTLRSKSRSPRRVKADRGEDVPPTPAPYRSGGSSGDNGPSSSRAKAPRRPHTSAGPRDKSNFTANATEPHQKRRSEVGWGAMGLPIPKDSVASLSEHVAMAPSSKTSGDIFKKDRSSSSGRLSSNSFWAVTAPPLKASKNHSSSGSSRSGAKSAGDVMQSTSSTSTTASSSSMSSGRSLGKVRGDRVREQSSAEEDEREDEMRRRYHGNEERRPGTAQSAQSSVGSPKLDSSHPRGTTRAPPSSFNPAIITKPDEGHHAVREWEEELLRIEEKSRKESDLVGFGRLRKRSFVSTMRDLFPSKNKVFNFGDDS